MGVKQVLMAYVRDMQTRESAAVLTRELSAVSYVSHQNFQACFLALLLLFTGSCILVVRFVDDPRRLGAVFAVTGVSIVGLIARMISLRRQKVTADLIATLARSLEPRQFSGVIAVLLTKL